MPRTKKRKKKIHRKESSSKTRPFNPVMPDSAKLKNRVLQRRSEITAPPDTAGFERDEEVDENAMFLQAFSDVEPLKDNKKTVARDPNPHLRPGHPAPNDELEAMTHLWELVHGVCDMDINFSDEYIEGAVRGFDKRLMNRLRKGQFPVQDYLDLHGLTKREAEIRVKDFLIQSYGAGLRCVLLIHGRGLNSEDHIPVLKERIPVWLSRGPARKFVLAFSTARPYDGGTGAIYVLLRRKKGQPYLQA